MNLRIVKLLQGLVVAAIPVALFAFSTGPVPRRTGAAVDGGLTCTACHRSFALNDDSGGSVIIRASAYTPGVKQRITVRVSHPEARRFGFQLTARTASDETKEAGAFTADDSVQVRCDPSGDAPCNGGLEFAEHRAAATNAGSPGPRTFTVEWTPPDAGAGPVVFYAAGNAANNDGTNSGDHIYTTKLIIPVAGAGPKPAISQNGVVHGASFSAGITQNGWVTIRGANLSFNTVEWQDEDLAGGRLPITLDGTSVKINGRDAFIRYASPTQLNVLAPVDDSTGNVQVQVTSNGIASDPVTTQMQRFTPAFFVLKDNYIAARHADNSLLGPTTLYPGASTPAKPGETITLYGSGFGPTTPAIRNGEVLTGTAALSNAATIRIGGVEVIPSFAGLSATGLYQFNVVVPAAAADGDVPVTASVGGVTSPTGPIIRVQR